MTNPRRGLTFWLVAAPLAIALAFGISACGDGGGDESGDDDADDDSAPDDDSTPDDDDHGDDDSDDPAFGDEYVAPWPQSNVEAPDYDESPEPGPMRQKAADYDAWHLANHQPFRVEIQIQQHFASKDTGADRVQVHRLVP